jgi:hypothetical protein
VDVDVDVDVANFRTRRAWFISPRPQLLSFLQRWVPPYGAVSQGSARPGWSRPPVINAWGRAVLTRFPRCRLKARRGVHHEHSTDALATVEKAQFVSCEGRGPPLESAFSAKCAASGPELGLGQERVEQDAGPGEWRALLQGPAFDRFCRFAAVIRRPFWLLARTEGDALLWRETHWQQIFHAHAQHRGAIPRTHSPQDSKLGHGRVCGDDHGAHSPPGGRK